MERNYLNLLKRVLEDGESRGDRTGTGCRSVFGLTARYDLRRGFPAVTTKKLWFKGVVHELLWFLSGSTNTSYLVENGVNIWNAWADAEGELGPVYGKQWRSWQTAEGTVDQIASVIESIKTNPMSRRHIVNAWNVSDLDEMALPPCHTMFQFYVNNDAELSCHLYQRSGDMFLGVPFNIASYSLLTHMIAQVCGLTVGEFVHTIGDAHIYDNHVSQVCRQLKRPPKAPPELFLNSEIRNIDDFSIDDIQLVGYDSHPALYGKVAV